ncbi:MAG: hypothetical protein ING71_17285 [Rhodocyclaceae bacterium]|nr:hypothetical protein [Rhodocyclaceae bacterium]
MTTKTVSLQVLLRDENQQVISAENAIGSTEDDGATVTIPNGYLPSILTVPTTDILRTVIPPPTDLPAPSSVARTNDEEANTSTLVFDA